MHELNCGHIVMIQLATAYQMQGPAFLKENQIYGQEAYFYDASHDNLSSFQTIIGEYLALTGARLNAKEMISAGLATHFVSSEVRHSVASISIFVGSHYCSLGCMCKQWRLGS